MQGKLTVFGGAVLASLMLAGPALATPFSVTRNDDPPPDACAPGDCSLREAVRAANAAPGPDSIALATGTYQLSQVGIENVALSGDLDVTDDLTLTGAGLAATTIDGGGAATGERVIEVDPQTGAGSPELILTDLTLTNGAGSFGAGLYAQNEARSSLERVSVSGNDANGFGGGIFNEDEAVMTIRASEVRDNSLTGSFGSGIGNQNQASMTIEDTSITGNRAPDGGFGGAVFNQNEGDLTIRDSTVAGNSAAGRGGGFFIQNESTTLIERTTVSGNSAGGDVHFEEAGGGLFIQNDAVVTLRNVTVSGNRADDGGGGIHLQNRPTVRIENTTVTANTADVDDDLDGTGSGGGVFAEFLPPGSVTLSSTIVAANAASTGPDCGGPGPVSSAGFNLIGNSFGCPFVVAAGDQVGTMAAPVDPRLEPLGANGGPTQTHVPTNVPTLDSPAVDRGISNGLATDQRGFPRVVDLAVNANGPGSDGTDVGAVEVRGGVCQGAVANAEFAVGPGDDAITGTEDPDRVSADAGNDRVAGEGGGDCLKGAAGKDSINGGGGKDRVAGGPGKDRVRGDGGKDKLKGNGGNDKVKAVDGQRDKVNCGPGKRDKAKVDRIDRVSRSCESIKARR